MHSFYLLFCCLPAYHPCRLILSPSLTFPPLLSMSLPYLGQSHKWHLFHACPFEGGCLLCPVANTARVVPSGRAGANQNSVLMKGSGGSRQGGLLQILENQKFLMKERERLTRSLPLSLVDAGKVAVKLYSQTWGKATASSVLDRHRAGSHDLRQPFCGLVQDQFPTVPSSVLYAPAVPDQ